MVNIRFGSVKLDVPVCNGIATEKCALARQTVEACLQRDACALLNAAVDAYLFATAAKDFPTHVLFESASSACGCPSGGLLQRPVFQPSMFHGTNLSEGCNRAMLRRTSEISTLPRSISAQAKYVPLRGSVLVNWYSGATASVNI